MQKNSHSFYLGIDIGGSNIKIGVVDDSGTISDLQKYHTKVIHGDDIEAGLIKLINTYLDKYPSIKKIGIGIPGLINKTRDRIIEVTAIPELNGIHLKQNIENRLPGITVCLENDAGAAALGELYFSKTPDTFLLITLGTGVGGAAIIDKKLFSGGDGNSLEIGHILSRNNKRLEQNVGKRAILDLAESKNIQTNEKLTIPQLVELANNKNPQAIDTFIEVGEILGEGLIAGIRILDIKHIIIGGGICAAFNIINVGIEKSLSKYLTPYYLKDLKIVKATLSNEAGLCGTIVPFLSNYNKL